jgi:hypothetical protein
MSPGWGVQLVEFRGAGQAHVEHPWPHGAYEVRADRRPGIARRVHLHPGLHLDVLQSRLAEVLRYPLADPWIGTVAAEGRP